MKFIHGIKLGGLQQKIFNLMLIFIIALVCAYAAIGAFQQKRLSGVVEGAGAEQQASIKAVSEATDIPLVLYNVPGRTGSNMLASTTLRLAELPGIVAVKEASGQIPQIREILSGRPEGFAVLSGNDDQTLELMEAGADGVISVASNLEPARMKALTATALCGKWAEARSLNSELAPLYDACFVESNPIPVTAGLSLLGLCSPEMRLPLTTAVESTFETLRRVVK